jgi:hypothetical protein
MGRLLQNLQGCGGWQCEGVGCSCSAPAFLSLAGQLAARLPLSFPWPAGARTSQSRPVLAPAKAGVGVPKPRGLLRCHGAPSDKREIRSRAVAGRGAS